MFRENIIRLRNIHRWSQETVAAKVGISRQAYTKWESGESLPDIKKCAALASIYGVTVDSLIGTSNLDGTLLTPAPKGKNIWGSVTLSEKGQIVIPEEARKKLGFMPGMRLIVLSDENGIALVKKDKFEEGMKRAWALAQKETDS